MRRPDFFFGRPHEHARIKPDNPHVLEPHLPCAAYELPLTAADAELFGPTLTDRLDALASEGSLVERDGRWFAAPSIGYPAGLVNIRSISRSEYHVVESASGRVLEHVDEAGALSQLHPGAVYLHQGEAYLVERLDVEAGVAYLRAGGRSVLHRVPRADRHPRRRDASEPQSVRRPVETRRSGGLAPGRGVPQAGPLRGQTLRRPTSETCPWTCPRRCFAQRRSGSTSLPPASGGCPASRRTSRGVLHAVEHAAIGVLPLFALCDRNDIGGVSTPMHPDTGEPQVFIYDGHPGGVGIAEHGFDVIEELLSATLEAVSQCPCADGCPSCIQSPKCGNNNRPLDKHVAARLLRDLTGSVVPVPSIRDSVGSDSV